MIINTKKGGTTPTGSLSITANGTYDVTNYASAVVSVSTATDPSPIITRQVTTIGNFGYADLATAFPEVLTYSASFITITAIGDNVPEGSANLFSKTAAYYIKQYTRWHCWQWYGSTSQYTPSEVSSNLPSNQSCNDFSITSSGTFSTNTSSRKFCGSGCTVKVIEIPLNHGTGLTTPLWGA